MNLTGIDEQYIKPYLDWKKGEYQWGDIAYGSHQPMLIHILDNTKGNIIEFGMGFYSTHLLHWYGKLANRYVLSVETDTIWFGQYDCNKILITPERIKEYDFTKMNFSVALIDGTPNEFRQKFIEVMKDRVDYFVVHDTDEEWKDIYKYDFSMFNDVYHFRDIKPNTSILSNKVICME